MARDDINELHRVLREVAKDECPSCGADEWLPTAEIPVVLPNVDLSGPKPTTMSGIETIFMVCGACGFVRLHATQILRMFK